MQAETAAWLTSHRCCDAQIRERSRKPHAHAGAHEGREAGTPAEPMAAARGRVGSQENTQKLVTLQARKSPWCSRLHPTSCPKVCLQGSLSTGSLSPQARWPAQCSAFPGEGCLFPSPPLPAPLQGISSHLPPLLQTAVIQRESHFQGNQKKKRIPGIGGNFSHKASGSKGALTAPRTQLGAPALSTLFSKQRTYPGHMCRGVGRERNVSPEWKLKSSITFCCHRCLAMGSLQLRELKKS